MNSIELPIISIINEEYARDISRKTRMNLESKKKQGLFVGSHTPYGYLKDSKDKNRLIVDTSVSRNVYNIFLWFVSGLSQTQIAKRLNGQGTISPGAYKVETGIRKMPKNANTETIIKWDAGKVSTILKCAVYTGDMVQGTTTSYSHKIKKRVAVSKDKWIIIRNTHEAIIERSTFDTAYELIQRKIKPKSNSRIIPSVLSGYMYCGECGVKMTRHTATVKGNKYSRFICSNSKKYSKDICSGNSIQEAVLLDVLVETIKYQIQTAADFKKLMQNMKSETILSRQIAGLKVQESKTIERKSQIIKIKAGLYEDFKKGVFNTEEYMDMKSNYDKVYEDINTQIISIHKNLNKATEKETQENTYITQFLRYKGIDKITRNIVVSLVDKITVSADCDITIDLKYQDEYEKLAILFVVKQ